MFSYDHTYQTSKAVNKALNNQFRLYSRKSKALKPPVQKHHILLIEDFPLVRNYLIGVFQSAGYDVTYCCNGEEVLALDYHQLARFDLLFMDISLPDIHGSTLMRFLKPELEKTGKTIPMIANLSTIDTVDENLKMLCSLSGAEDIYQHNGQDSEILSLLDKHIKNPGSASTNRYKSS